MAIIPKDEGYGMMVSAFQHREFGCGVNLNQEELKFVNNRRRQNWPNYKSVDSAMKCNGKVHKDDLKYSPYSIFFEFGAQKKDTGTMITWHIAV